MAFQFRLPDLGEGITEAHIVKWLVKEGDAVEEHKEILEVETDKALVKVPSPRAGTILSRDVKEGETVSVGTVMCSIGEKGEKVKKKSTTVMGEIEEGTEVLPPVKRTIKKKAGTTVQALPAVRKLAQKLGVDLQRISGTGLSGRVTEKDVKLASKTKNMEPVQQKEKAGKLKASKDKEASVSFDSFGRVLRVPLKGVRKIIAEHMAESKNKIPHVTHMDYADVTKLAAFREKEKKIAEQKGVKLTFLPFIVKAVVLALKEFPYVNTSLENDEVVIKQYYNIGIAVDTLQGLMVPVVKHADALTILEIAKKIFTYAEKARERTIDIKDLQGGTFSITNIGSLGGVFATPIIDYPQCAILALGRMQDMAVPAGKKIEVRKMLPLSFTFDHRIIDGAMAAKFVNEIKMHLEDPDNLLMGY